MYTIFTLYHQGQFFSSGSTLLEFHPSPKSKDFPFSKSKDLSVSINYSILAAEAQLCNE